MLVRLTVSGDMNLRSRTFTGHQNALTGGTVRNVNIRAERWINIIATHFVDTGKQWVVDRIDGNTTSSTTDQKWVGWGTGAGTTAEGDSTLFTEDSDGRANGTQSQVTTTVTGDTFQVVGTNTSTGTKTITNAGVFDSDEGGTNVMLMKGDHTGVPLLSNDSIEYTFQLHVDQ